MIISDSRLIVDYLESQARLPLDRALTADQRAISTAFQRLLEQDLIRVILYSRWVDRDGLLSKPNLVTYCERIRGEFFSPPLEPS